MTGTSDRKRRRVAVVGAGVVGASVAYNLARQGVHVLLIDSSRIAGGVTKDSFAWVGLSASARDGDDVAIRRLASAELDRLSSELSHPFALRRHGALSWSAQRGDPEGVSLRGDLIGPSLRVVDQPEIARLEPGLVDPPSTAVLAEDDGSVDPVALTASLVHGAREFGAEVSEATVVRGVITSGGRVTGLDTSTGTIDVDAVVLAAGTGTPSLALTVGARIPVDASPCILVRLATPRPLLNGIVSGPDFELRQASDTLLLAAEDYIDHSTENGPEAIAREALETIRREIVGGEDVALESVAVGLRPMPGDGRPIVGPVGGADGLYVLAAHAAVALGAGLGRLAAEEIALDHRLEELAPFRPSRFD